MKERELLYSSGQIVSESHIEDFLYAAELAGSYHSVRENRKPEYNIMLLVLEGKVNCRTDMNEREAGAGTFLMIHSWTAIKEITFSCDFHGFAIEVSNELMLDIFRNNNPFPPDLIYRMSGDKDILSLSQDESETILADMKNIANALGKKQHHYLMELSYAHMYILITDMANMLWMRFGHGELPHTLGMSRPDMIMQQFTELLGQNIENGYSVGYYAEKLCISKQYLSMIVKEKTNSSIGRVITTMRAERAIRLLRNPDLSIKQIADRLSFPDQSSFGKFMKKYMGISPLKYRKNLFKNLIPQTGGGR